MTYSARDDETFGRRRKVSDVMSCIGSTVRNDAELRVGNPLIHCFCPYIYLWVPPLLADSKQSQCGCPAWTFDKEKGKKKKKNTLVSECNPCHQTKDWLETIEAGWIYLKGDEWQNRGEVSLLADSNKNAGLPLCSSSEMIALKSKNDSLKEPVWLKEGRLMTGLVVQARECQ